MDAVSPTLSILIPIHNCRAFVREALQSVLSQSFNDYEVIVIDDASTDGSREWLRTKARWAASCASWPMVR